MGLFSAGFGVSCKKQRLAEQYNHLSMPAFAQIISPRVVLWHDVSQGGKQETPSKLAKQIW